MPPYRSWQTILAGADGLAGLTVLARSLGFSQPEPLDEESRLALGITDDFSDVHIAAGVGATRALLLVVREAPAVRDCLTRLAGRLSTRAPHLLWMVLAAATSTTQSAIVTWSVERRPPRIAALIYDRANVLASDVEAVASVAAATGASDLLMHGRWFELLGRELLSNRFYLTLERLVAELALGASGAASQDDRREVALLNISRLLFLAFVETRGWLDGDRGFLARVFDDCMRGGGDFHRRVLLPLFFGTLNTRPARRASPARAFGRVPFLNGGLFHRSPAERRARRLVMPDDAWGRFYDELLLRYRFTAREESGEWTEAAVDPEMLGRAFESLMASRDRRKSGVFFTPHTLVERITDAALHALLVPRGVDAATVPLALRGQPLAPSEASCLLDALRGVRLLDPACGSGAFLLQALDRLAALRRACGDARPGHLVRREVLSESIFGVDASPTAVWLCELRLWLSVVIECEESDPQRVPPLPNLDHNVRCGDALAGGDLDPLRLLRPGQSRRNDATATGRLRTRYAKATGARKRTLSRELDRAERGEARRWLTGRLEVLCEERRALLAAARGRDLFGARRGALAGEREALARLRSRVRDMRTRLRALANGGAVPFAFAAHFPDAAAVGGFDVVIGNPPWVRLHRIAAELRAGLRREFVVYREAAWESGARDARAGRGFAAQVDMASLFVERGMHLARQGGVLALLIPAKLWRSLAGGGVRKLLSMQNSLRVLEDWSEAPAVFDAAVYPALVVATRGGPEVPAAMPAEVEATMHRGHMAVSWRMPVAAIALDETPGAPWLILPPDARAAFDRIARAGVPLVRSGIGQPALGVKCGYNEAFLVRAVREQGCLTTVRSGERTGAVESRHLRPVLRGEHVHPWRIARSMERIVFPCDDEGETMSRLPPGVRAWLLPHRRRLQQRSDARGLIAWWSVFRTGAARFDRPRVVWADVGRAPHALILPAGDRTVPINSCYVLHCRDLEDAFALAALLNSAPAAAWLGAVAEPARGGYRRFLAWTVARLPVPDDWARARTLLAPLGADAYAGRPPSSVSLLDAVLDAYRLRAGTVVPLLTWMSR